MFERRHQPLLPWRAFLGRLMISTALGFALIVVSLLIGMVGYHVIEDLPWVLAFANAAMLLSGMGPLTPMQTEAGLWFAGCYALYSGLALILILGIIFAPLIHRGLHHFHIEADRD